MPVSHLLHDAEWLRHEYSTRPIEDIAGELGCAPMTVWRYLGVHGIPTRSRGARLTATLKPGEQFGRLTVIGPAETRNHRSYSNCQCECGTRTVARSDLLKSGETRSCGCLAEPHGHATGGKLTPEYRVWASMITRCTNPNNKDWHLYGGRGITVHPDWIGRGGFARFLAHIGPRPAGLSIDRIDNDGNYEPGNVRWATASQQNQNRRSWKGRK